MLAGRKRDEDKTPVMSAILNRFDGGSKNTSFFWRLYRKLTQRKTETLKLTMLTSCQWPGVPTFDSKQRTLVCFCASDRSYDAFNVVYVVRHPLENSFPWTSPPPHSSEITAFEPPSSSELPRIFRGGGVWIFSFQYSSLNHIGCVKSYSGDLDRIPYFWTKFSALSLVQFNIQCLGKAMKGWVHHNIWHILKLKWKL